MPIKVYLHAITNDGLVYMYVSLTEDERLRKVVQYCRDAWTDLFLTGARIPDNPQEIVAKFFNAPGNKETLHYDTDWLRPEDFAACPNATVIDDSILLTPQLK